VARYIWQRPDWPRWRWSETVLAEVLSATQRKQDFLAGLAQGLDGDHLNSAIAELTTRETVSTSAIEGVKLDPDEVRSSIMRRLGLGASDSQADRLSPAGRGMIDVLADSTQNLQPLTLERLFAWHNAIFPSGRSGLSLILVGMLRGKETGWAVSPIILEHRKEYYSQLESTQKGNLDITEWLRWSTASIEQAYDEARACIERVIQVAHFWTRHRETPLTPRQRRLLEMALTPNDPEDGWLTAKWAARQTKVGRVTASRDLARMEELAVIEKDPRAGGRSTRYRVRLSERSPSRLIKELNWN
jgi:Fic family protein